MCIHVYNYIYLHTLCIIYIYIRYAIYSLWVLVHVLWLNGVLVTTLPCFIVFIIIIPRPRIACGRITVVGLSVS